MLYRYSFDSPVGCLRLEEEDGYLTGLHFDPDPSVRYADDTDLLRQTRKQLAEYFAGSRTSFSIPLKLQGTDFQKRVWKVLQTIPYAKTMSYGQVAALAGNPKACRAVGMATAIRLPSLCPVIESSVQTAEWSVTVADCGSRKNC